MNKDYFRAYYSLERENWWFLARMKILEKRVKDLMKGKQSIQILNIGVATGAGTAMLEKFGKVTSLEYDEDCVEFLKKEVGIDVIHGSITELPFTNDSFDLVCAFDVLEHVEQDQIAVNEMFRVCKPEGKVFVTVPALMSLWGPHDIVNQHFRRYTKHSLLTLFPKNQIQFCSYFNTILFFPIWIIRMLNKRFSFKRKGAGSDFDLMPSGFLNTLLYKLFLLEIYWQGSGRLAPIGVSLMLEAECPKEITS